MDDPYNLRRFTDAQDAVFEQVRGELRAGRKVGHWMWFIFPQVAGLGRSETARFYAIASRAEAEAYLKHPVLGPRLEECTRLLLGVEGRSARQILGSPDDLKLRSCLTLFAAVAPGNALFGEALGKYFGGEPDRLTLERL
jgi:uncharacterized protein (DUF1810 family)